MNTVRTIVGEIVGRRGHHRIIVREFLTKRLFELDRFAIITPVDQVLSLSEFGVTKNDFEIIEGRRVKIGN